MKYLQPLFTVSCENSAQQCCYHKSCCKIGKTKQCFMTHNPLTLELPFYATKLINNKFYSIRRDQQNKKKKIISAKIVFNRWWSSGDEMTKKKKKNSWNSSAVRAYTARTFLFAFLRSFNVLQTHRFRSPPLLLVKRKFNIFVNSNIEEEEEARHH